MHALLVLAVVRVRSSACILILLALLGMQAAHALLS